MSDRPATDRLQGLTQAEAAARLAEDGPNELPGSRHRSVLRIASSVLREPMLALLLAAGAIYFLLGDLDDAAILMAFVGLTIGIAVVQEVRSERAIEALRDLSMPLALVVRDGRRMTVASREVVRGDLLVLSEGSRVAADGWLVEANTLQADEAILTGESVSVTKAALRGAQPGEPPVPGPTPASAGSASRSPRSKAKPRACCCRRGASCDAWPWAAWASASLRCCSTDSSGATGSPRCSRASP